MFHTATVVHYLEKDVKLQITVHTNMLIFERKVPNRIIVIHLDLFE